MKRITRKDVGVSLVVATLGALICLWFWLACERFPPPTTNSDGTLDLKTIVFDDRPLIITFNWYTTSKVLIFLFSFAYTFAVALISRSVWRMVPTVGSTMKEK